jgi:hypothetical protein
MTLKLVFNPFAGTFDYVDVTDTSAFARFVPTLLEAEEVFTVPDDAQALMVRTVVMDAGASIDIGENAVLVQVA